jgi:hypothetical protein
MDRAVERLDGETRTFEDDDPDAESCFSKDSENCCSDRASAFASSSVGAGPSLPEFETSWIAEPNFIATGKSVFERERPVSPAGTSIAAITTTANATPTPILRRRILRVFALRRSSDGSIQSALTVVVFSVASVRSICSSLRTMRHLLGIFKL